MHRKLLLLILTLLPLQVLGQSRGFVVSPVNAEAAVQEQKLLQGIEFLSSEVCEGRSNGTKGHFLAAEWIRFSLKRAGVVPFDGCWADGFNLEGGGTGHNVLGMYPGTGERYIIIMAHYDNLGILSGRMYPGADSNASGVVAMTTLAEMFHRMEHYGRRYRTNVIFVGLDGKMRNFSGAKALYRRILNGRLKDPVTGKVIGKGDIDLVINIDQIGSSEAPLHPGRSDYLILLGDSAYARRDALTNVNLNRRINMDLAFDYYGSADFTRLFLTQVCDQRVFLDGGMPAVMFTSGITMRNNKPVDTADGIDLPVLRKRIILIFHWLSKWL